MMIWKTLILFVVLSQRWVAQGAPLTILNPQQLEGLIPNHLTDYSGFQLPNNIILPKENLGPLPAPTPLFPIFKNGLSSKEFVGLMVPARYLGLREESTPNNQIIINTVSSSSSPRLQKIRAELESLRFADGERLYIYQYKNNLYAIRSDFQVTYENETSFGFSINFRNRKTIALGTLNTFGANLNIGRSVSYVDGEHGINLAQSFNDFFETYESLVSGDRLEDMIDRAIRFTPYITSSLSPSADSDLPKTTPAIYAKDLGSADETIPPLAMKVEIHDYSEELQNRWEDLHRHLKTEIEWRKKVESSVANQLVVNDDQANTLIQEVCDQLASAYAMPNELWPRCRIAATWAPNAWAYPGGDIFITAGLLGVLSDLDAVKFVLGHEIGHVLGRHTSRLMPAQKAYMYYANSIALTTTAAASYLALSGGAGYLGEVNWLTWFPKSMVSSIGSSLPVQYGVMALQLAPAAAIMARSRSAEWQADRFGHQSAVASGADSQAIKKGWAEFRAFISAHLSDGNESWLQTILADHPNSEEREKQIEFRAEKLDHNLNRYFLANRLSEDKYKTYRKIHSDFHDKVEAWGEAIQKKRKTGQSVVSNYAIESLISPSGQCVIHALSEN